MSIYNGLIARNCAPKGAASIGVFNGNGRRVGKIPLGSLSLPADLGQKQYSFGCLSDIHIQYTTGTADLQNALTWLCQTEGVDFITVSGDLTQSGTAAHLKTYADCVDTYARRADGTAVPVYAAGGNHEARETSVETVLPAGIGLPLYYTVSGEADTEGATATTPGRNFHSDAVGQDVFVFLSILHKDQSAYNGVQGVPLFGTGDDYTGTGNTAFPSRTVMTWLYRVLEKNRDRRCFLFQHIRPYDAAGNFYGIYSYDLWGSGSNRKQDAVVFESFLTHYKNILHFHGHSHLRLGLQELVEGNGDGDVTKNCNVDRKIGSADTGWSIHVPSLTVPRTGDASGAASCQNLYAESEGYVVDVYDKYIILRGRKFQTATDDSINSTESSQTTDYTGTYSPGYFLPVATYCLDTDFTTAEAGTYTDSTGIVMTDDSENDDKDDKEEPSLTGITAAYSGGPVAAGTTLDQLTGITVTAT
ncbi:MAG: metallophosphoesterase family protein, partial [Eubacteriales bacterium]